MTKIAIFGDTSHDLTFEIGKELGIELIPYQIQMGDKEYTDQVDIDSRTFYQTMAKYDVLTTGVPSPQVVIEALDRVKEEGYTDAIMIASSSKLTGMVNLYNSIKAGYEGINLHIFDTLEIASSAGFMTMHAAQNRNDGKSVEEILEELENDKKNASIFALFRIAIILVNAIINPDKLTDSKNGFLPVLRNFVLMFVLLVLTPRLFTEAYKIQSTIVEGNYIQKLFLTGHQP